MWLFIEPDEHHRASRAVTIGVVVIIGVLSGLTSLQLFSLPLPPGSDAVLRAADPLRIVNSYGLFAVMTTAREEIILQGSNDGANWRDYEFPYKPGNVYRPPPIVAPYQPRLDWQMWFAALGSYRSNRWFVDLVMRLLQGEPRVLRLFSYNPFPKAPPKYVRALTYSYTFTHFGGRSWWNREPTGTYLPAVSLR